MKFNYPPDTPEDRWRANFLGALGVSIPKEVVGMIDAYIHYSPTRGFYELTVYYKVGGKTMRMDYDVPEPAQRYELPIEFPEVMR